MVCLTRYVLKLKLQKLIQIFFDEDGFPLTRSPNDLLNYTKYFLLIKEVIKDAQKYVPDNLENTLEKNLKTIAVKTGKIPIVKYISTKHINKKRKIKFLCLCR